MLLILYWIVTCYSVLLVILICTANFCQPYYFLCQHFGTMYILLILQLILCLCFTFRFPFPHVAYSFPSYTLISLFPYFLTQIFNFILYLVHFYFFSFILLHFLYCHRGVDGLYCFRRSFLFKFVRTISHEPIHWAWWCFTGTCTLATAQNLLNIKVISQGRLFHSGP